MTPEIKASIATMIPLGNRLELPKEQMANYAAVKKVLIAAEGKYIKNGFTFPSEADIIQAKLVAGTVMNDKKVFQLFETPDKLAKIMVSMAKIKIDELVLEPSAGRGRIALAIKAAGTPAHCLTLIELDDKRIADLIIPFTEERIIHGDFLDYKLSATRGKYHKIIMNPPFTKGQDIKHIQHAITLLHPGGAVIAICSAGSRQEKVLKPLSTVWKPLPEDTFKESGTKVRTVMGIYHCQETK
jgi:16S rRNA G1207 methylase RsmC